MLTAALKSKPIYQIRFDREKSPDHINGGAGWTEEYAKDWLMRCELSMADVAVDAMYIRAKQNAPTGKDVEIDDNFDVGVAVIRCKA